MKRKKKPKAYVRKLTPYMALYFAYGRNMSTDEMIRRCPSAKAICAAVLPDYRLVFDVPCRFVYGCAANIRQDCTQVVHGVLWAIDHNDFDALDEREKYYKREVATVFQANGKAYDAYVYFSPGLGRDELPDAQYMETLLTGCVEHRLPQQWHKMLSRLQTQ